MNMRPSDIKIFGMQNLMLESALSKLEDSGVPIGHAITIAKSEVVDVDLFEHDIMHQAKKMADFYVLYYALENSIRRLIEDRLKEEHGADWWEKKIPAGVKQAVAEAKKREKDSIMSVRSDSNLSYTNFGELIDVFNANWADFSDTLRSQKAVQQILSQFNHLRNVIAHSCELNEDEILRFKLLIKDWLRIQS